MADTGDNTLFLPDDEGMFDAQLALPLPAGPWAAPVTEIVKRDGRVEPFDKQKITEAIARAARSVGVEDADLASSIAAAVGIYLGKCLRGQPPTADQVSDAIERVLIQMTHGDIALAYARYRDRRMRIRRLRQGDLRNLISEIEEARHDRECSAARADALLRVRTSQDRLMQWDRSRIVEALQRETGLDFALATLIAAEVEKQIQEAGIETLTAALVRELVGAKMIEHGLWEENELRRRLGVPLYDASRIIRGATPETLGRDPEHTDRILAQAVKKEFALAEVFSPAVTYAHLTGDIHLRDLPFVDRLQSADHSLVWIAARGIRLPGGVDFTSPAKRPETLLAHTFRYSDALDTLFTGAIAWHGFNHSVAPFIEQLKDDALRRFARALFHECAFRTADLQEDGDPMRITLWWNPPEDMADAEAAGPAADGRSYREFNTAARRMAEALIEVYRAGSVNDAHFNAPMIDIVITEDIFQSIEGNHFLRLAASAALRRPRVRFILALDKTVSNPPLWRPKNVVWHRVALNLPRAAIKGENESGLYVELERLARIAAAAHKEKRDFIELLLDPTGRGPLSALALEQDGRPYVTAEDGLFAVDVEGLHECARIMAGARTADFGKRCECMASVLKQLDAILRTVSETEGIHCVLAANTDPRVSRRFAALDADAYPQITDGILTEEAKTQTLRYTTGVALPQDSKLNPIEIARIEGTFHQHLHERTFSHLVLPLAHTAEETLAGFIKKAKRQTNCAGIVLQRP